MTELTSDCCGTEEVGNSADYGVCPSCKEHCEYTEHMERPKYSDYWSGLNPKHSYTVALEEYIDYLEGGKL